MLPFANSKCERNQNLELNRVAVTNVVAPDVVKRNPGCKMTEYKQPVRRQMFSKEKRIVRTEWFQPVKMKYKIKSI
jgi:hypothetical protein